MKAKEDLHGQGRRRRLIALPHRQPRYDRKVRRSARTALGAAACLLTAVALVVPTAAQAAVGVKAAGGEDNTLGVNAEANPTTCVAPCAVTFNASVYTYDESGTVGASWGRILGNWFWNSGDANSWPLMHTSRQQNPTFQYNHPGDFRAFVIFTDDDGESASDSVTVHVRSAETIIDVIPNPNRAVITTPGGSVAITFTAKFSSPYKKPPKTGFYWTARVIDPTGDVKAEKSANTGGNTTFDIKVLANESGPYTAFFQVQIGNSKGIGVASGMGASEVVEELEPLPMPSNGTPGSNGTPSPTPPMP
jgi:hypothetical protein